MNHKASHSLAARTWRLAVWRIAIVCICGGAVSYAVNHTQVQNAARAQLTVSTEQILQLEAQPFQLVRDLERNFLAEFQRLSSTLSIRHALVNDFDAIFYRHADGSYTQRPGLFEGEPLPDGRRFPNMSATYAPEVPPDEDVKARFALSYMLSYQYGSAMKGRFFNFYGVVPEKGFPIYQDADIAKVFKYEGPDALRLETYEFYWRGFTQKSSETIFTRIYWDPSNKSWMTTIAMPDTPDPSGKHRIMACVDVLLDQLMERTAKPALPGTRSTIFAVDDDGTLVFDAIHSDEITRTSGEASIRSLKLTAYRPLLDASRMLAPGAVTLVDGDDEIAAVGRIPDTPWVLAVHYPKALMRPAIVTNLGIVFAVGLITLLIEIFILRSILQKQVAEPLIRLIRATQLIGSSSIKPVNDVLLMQGNDEIGQLGQHFSRMALRVWETHDALEQKVQSRTAELEQLNSELLRISMTDEMTGVANRRQFDDALAFEMERGPPKDGALMLAMIDVDLFKRYNDRYGHPAGDVCLRTIAEILKMNVRREGDVVARYGGEEFAVIARVADSDGARKIGNALCKAVAAARIRHEEAHSGHVTISVGIALAWPGTETTPESLLLEADRALYHAKHLGRNQCVLAVDRLTQREPIG